MAEWRFARRWTNKELGRRLEELRNRRASVPTNHPEEMTEDRGWRAEVFEAVLGFERPGRPAADGLFARARRAMRDYRFSDPSIVEAHFRADEPMLGRNMLLEIKVLGLHYLCGVRVGDLFEHDRDRDTGWGFRYDTLEGHIERGSEWFELSKDHGSGRVRLRIRSRWRRGDLPNAWSRIGFTALAGPYRGLWLRRAHQRLRMLAAPGAPAPGRAFTHEGPGEEMLPARFAAAGTGRTLAAAALLGAASGLRSTAGLALVAVRGVETGASPGAGHLEQRFARPGTALLAALAAAGELAADKHPHMPSRLDPPALAGRIGAGALSGAVLAARWRSSRWLAAGAGGTTAAAASLAGYLLRARLQQRMPPLVAGICEDALVLSVAASLWHRLAAGVEPGRRP